MGLDQVFCPRIGSSGDHYSFFYSNSIETYLRYRFLCGITVDVEQGLQINDIKDITNKAEELIFDETTETVQV